MRRSHMWSFCPALLLEREELLLADPIYLIDKNNMAVRMEPTPYAKEEEFQEVLERFPELLAGEQIDRDNPRRWLLVAREIGIPDGEDASARWQLDHFFVDQDGIPTLVEVKRQSDTRLRREVVGQVLDYAANGARFWPAAYLQQQFEKTCQQNGSDPVQLLKKLLDPRDSDPAAFWQEVEGKLREGDIRLIFLADEVPSELQRIVEFLNSQMTKTEVLAIEVRRYAGQGFSTHVPRLLGQTTEALAAKAPSRAGARRKWDKDLFFEAAASQAASTQDALRSLYALAQEAGFDFRWGTGSMTGSLNIIVPAVCPRSIVTAQTNGILKLNFGWLPPETQDLLAAFSRSKMDATLPDGWQQAWPEVRPEVWVPATDALLSFLGSLGRGT